jgi:hypothetical protein
MLFPVLGLAIEWRTSGLSDVDSGKNNRWKWRIPKPYGWWDYTFVYRHFQTVTFAILLKIFPYL